MTTSKTEPLPYFDMASAPKDRPILIIDDGKFYGLAQDDYAAVARWVPSQLLQDGGSFRQVYTGGNFCRPLGWMPMPKRNQKPQSI